MRLAASLWGRASGVHERTSAAGVTVAAAAAIARWPSTRRVGSWPHSPLGTLAAVAAAFDTAPVTVLVGTQTGTAMSFAESLRDVAESTAVPQPVQVIDLGDYDARTKFVNEAQVVLILACYGAGEPTDNARAFVQWLADRREPLVGLRYTVFGLGSSKTHKSNYNIIAKTVDARLEALGARRCYPLGLGDDSGCIELDFQQWQQGLVDSLKHPRNEPAADAAPTAQSATAAALASTSPAARSEPAAGPRPSTPGPTPAGMPIAAPEGPYGLVYRPQTACATSYEEHATKLLRDRGFYRPGTTAMAVRFHRPLNPTYPESMLEMGLTAALKPYAPTSVKLAYATGDHIGIYPENDAGLVDRIVRRCSLDPDLEVAVAPNSINSGSVHRRTWPFPEGLRVRDLLTRCLELQSMPQPAALAVLAAAAADPAERARLLALASTAVLYKDVVWRQNRHLADLLDEFSSVQPTLAALVQAVPVLRPRFYSIASSALRCPDQVRVLYRWVHYRHALTGEERQGVCTRYLKGRMAAPTDLVGPSAGMNAASVETPSTILGFVRTSSFRQPADPATPCIFIAGGSGIAPVRAFLDERLFLARTGKAQYGPAILLFGVREPDDLVCNDLIQACLQTGALTDAFISYSTPPPPGAPAAYLARFVAQDIDEHGGQIWRALAAGGHIYLCGGASAFASTCHVALRRVFSAHGGLVDMDAQERFFLQLLQTKRYQEDLAD